MSPRWSKCILIAVFLGVGYITLMSLSVVKKSAEDRQNDESAKVVAREAMADNPDLVNNAILIEGATNRLDGSASAERVQSERTPAVAVSAEPDDAWLRLPRGAVALVDVAVEFGRQSDPESLLLRSTVTNPSDMFIPAGVRTEMAAALARRCKTIADMHESMDSIMAQEWAYLLARGATRVLSYDDYLAGLAPSERKTVDSSTEAFRKTLVDRGMDEEAVQQAMAGVVAYVTDPVPAAFMRGTKDGDRGTYWCKLEDMPQTRQAAELYYAAAFDACSYLVDFFQRHAALGDQAAIAQMEESMARFAKFHQP